MEPPGGRRTSGRAVNIAGWTAVVITSAFTSLWAFWGAIENFHEGWYFISIWRNLGMMFGQYLIWGALFGGGGAVAVQWPRAGAALFTLCAVLLPMAGIRTSAAVVLVSAPLVLLGVLFFFGRPRPRKWALRIVAGVPFLVMILSGAGIAIRVSGRIPDGDTSRPALYRRQWCALDLGSRGSGLAVIDQRYAHRRLGAHTLGREPAERRRPVAFICTREHLAPAHRG